MLTNQCELKQQNVRYTQLTVLIALNVAVRRDRQSYVPGELPVSCVNVSIVHDTLCLLQWRPRNNSTTTSTS